MAFIKVGRQVQTLCWGQLCSAGFLVLEGSFTWALPFLVKFSEKSTFSSLNLLHFYSQLQTRGFTLTTSDSKKLDFVPLGFLPHLWGFFFFYCTFGSPGLHSVKTSRLILILSTVFLFLQIQLFLVPLMGFRICYPKIQHLGILNILSWRCLRK